MLKIFERIIKGKHRILDENLKKYGLQPSNVKNFKKGYKEVFFITTTGTVVLKINRDSLDICEFFKNSHMFIYGMGQYINVNLVKSSRKYFSKRPFKLMVYFNDNTKIKLSHDYQVDSLKHLNDEIRKHLNDEIRSFL